MQKYYVYGSDQAIYGPFTVDEMRSQVAEHRIDANTQVCLEGTETWQPAREVAGLFSGASAPPPPALTAPSSSEYTAPEHGPLQPVGYVGPVALTLCLCLIGGIVTIVYTSQVNEAAARGDAEAYARLKSTRQGWIIASIIIGLIANGIQIAYFFANP